MSHIFLSYSRADKDEARDLFVRLRRRGFELWFDQESLLPGHSWELEIDKAIQSAALVLVLLSSRSVDRTGYAQKEIRMAISAMEKMPEAKPYLVPVRLDNCQIPTQLSHIHCGLLADNSDFEKLAKALYEFVGLPRGAEVKLPLTYNRLQTEFLRDPGIMLPGYGVAGLHIGATPEQVQRRFGEANEERHGGQYMNFKALGLSFLIEEGVVKTIFTYQDGADGFVGFAGHTPDGISMTSTRREVEDVYGRPTTVGGSGVIPYWVSYRFGISITYDTLDTKKLDAGIHHVAITAPKD